MAAQADQRVRASQLVPMVLLLIVTGLVGLRWVPVVNVLGLLVIAFGLVLPPRITAALGVLAVSEAVLISLVVDLPDDMLRVINVAFASALAVVLSLLLERRLRNLLASRIREKDILAAMPEAVVVLDAQGVLRKANAGLARLVPGAAVGQRLHPLLGHVLSDGTACAGGCPLDGVRPSTLTGTPIEGERVTRDGRTVPIAYTVSKYGSDQLVATLRDVSARVAAQEDREVLLQAAARTEEQGALRQALSGPRLRLNPVDDLVVDSWVPDGQRGKASSSLASLSQLPDGRSLLLMANSEGEGYQSTRDAWQALYVARAHLAAGAPLAEMISRAADSLADEADQPAASIVGAVIDPVTGFVQVASGRHPPPLLVRADGSTSWLDAPGRALGDELPRSVRLASGEVGPGDSLLVYGMGIVDGTRDVVEGMSALRAAAVALRGVPIPGVAERIGRAAVPPGVTREQADILMVLRLA